MTDTLCPVLRLRKYVFMLYKLLSEKIALETFGKHDLIEVDFNSETVHSQLGLADLLIIIRSAR